MVAVFSNIYNGVIKVVDGFVPHKFRPLWMHPAGPKTIFFWAPLFKWGLVIAGIGDLQRPANTLSIRQCSSLALTGVIWSRYSVVIIPKNYALLSVNAFVALTQFIQVYRAYSYQISKDKNDL